LYSANILAMHGPVHVKFKIKSVVFRVMTCSLLHVYSGCITENRSACAS